VRGVERPLGVQQRRGPVEVRLRRLGRVALGGDCVDPPGVQLKRRKRGVGLCDGGFEGVEGSARLYTADSTIISIGQGPRSRLVNTTKGLRPRSFALRPFVVFTRKGLRANERGLLVTDEDGCTTRPGVFASGDVVNGAKTVVEAVAYSKKVAEAMHAYIQNLSETADSEPSTSC